MQGMEISHLGAVFAGLLSFASPCVLPLVPPYLAFLGGVTVAQMEDGENVGGGAGQVFWPSVAFVLGFSTVFVAMGATASGVSRFIAEYLHVLGPIAGVVIILLGLHFIGVFRLTTLYREARFHIDARPAGLLGAYVIGLAFAFGWTPCVGPVLATILFVAGSRDELLFGASLLGAYALGIGIPFLLAAAFAGTFMGVVRRFRRHIPTIEKATGGLLVLTGVLFVTGSVNDVANWLLVTFPGLGQIG